MRQRSLDATQDVQTGFGSADEEVGERKIAFVDDWRVGIDCESPLEVFQSFARAAGPHERDAITHQHIAVIGIQLVGALGMGEALVVIAVG